MQNAGDKKNFELTGRPRSAWIKIALVAAVVAAAACGCKIAAKETTAGGQAPAEEPLVTVTSVGTADVSSQPSEYVGRVEAIQYVQVKPQISGEIAKVCFKEGALVRAGDLLFQIEPAPYQATVELRRAELERARATLAEAEKYHARVTAADARAVSAADRDTAESNLLQGRAALSQAKASLRLAEIDLGYCRITSPITGKIGAAAFTKGNYVTPQSGALASIVQMDPIRVSYSLPDRDYLDQLELFKKQGPVYKTKLVLSNGTSFEAAGERDFEDNVVERQTGTVLVRLRYANGDGMLIPGGMVRVFARPAKSRAAAVVPQSAVMADGEGDYVYLLNADDTVRAARVALGREIGQMREVKEGLSAGQKVVVSGIQSLSPGVKVRVGDAVAAQADPDGKEAN